MTGTAPLVRTLALPEIGMLLDWAAGEGWNPGTADAAAFQAADPDGFLGAFVEGEMVAGISAVAYGATSGFIGLYIVRPDRRGQGFGKAAWDAGMKRLANRTIGLDGVPAQQANYRSRGFREAYGTIRYAGRAKQLAASRNWTATAPVTASKLVLSLDSAAFGASRAAFLERWVAPPRMAIAATTGGRVCGYGVLRRCRIGWKVGPLFADTTDAVLAILARLFAEAGDAEIALDVPEPRSGFARILTDAGLEPVFETARMYRGDPTPALHPFVHAVTTLELG